MPMVETKSLSDAEVTSSPWPDRIPSPLLYHRRSQAEHAATRSSVSAEDTHNSGQDERRDKSAMPVGKWSLSAAPTFYLVDTRLEHQSAEAHWSLDKFSRRLERSEDIEDGGMIVSSRPQSTKCPSITNPREDHSQEHCAYVSNKRVYHTFATELGAWSNPVFDKVYTPWNGNHDLVFPVLTLAQDNSADLEFETSHHCVCPVAKRRKIHNTHFGYANESRGRSSTQQSLNNEFKVETAQLKPMQPTASSILASTADLRNWDGEVIVGECSANRPATDSSSNSLSASLQELAADLTPASRHDAIGKMVDWHLDNLIMEASSHQVSELLAESCHEVPAGSPNNRRISRDNDELADSWIWSPAPVEGAEITADEDAWLWQDEDWETESESTELDPDRGSSFW